MVQLMGVMYDNIALVLGWPNCISISRNEINRPGRLIDHQPPSSSEVKERVELRLDFPLGLHACSRVNFTLPFAFLVTKSVQQSPS